MLEIKKQSSIKIKLFHTNYNLHSNSKIMNEYCLEIAKKNDLKIFLEACDSKFFNNTNIESKARQFRYDKIKNLCKKHKIKYVLTAHHEDDQIETVYMAELNNSSWVSKIGIRRKSYLSKSKVLLIRPMLDISKKEILKYAIDHNLKYYNDPTNIDLRFFRNKIRQEINVKVKKIDFRKKYLNISKNNSHKLGIISNDIKNNFYNLIFYLKSDDLCIIDRELLKSYSIEFIFLFIKKILKDHFNFKENLSSKYWKNINDYFWSNKTGTDFSIENQIYICKTSKYIYLYTHKNFDYLYNLNIAGNHFLRLGTISISVSDYFIKFNKHEGISIPYSIFNDLKLCNWNHGDFCISHNGNTIKVSDIFINNKFSLFHKKNYPILKYLDKIIWIPNLYSSINSTFKSVDKYLIIRWNVNV
tara:strand:- start:1869 stop:3113 length:1245 start_codon:yes stop_codon:yes gene_type:complete